MPNRDRELHPQTEQWDTLRAGLATPEATAALTTHLAQCPICAARGQFTGAIKHALDLADDELARELRLRRRQALTRAHERGPGRLSLAAGIGALALGATLYLGWHTSTMPLPQASATREHNDVYADIDFYLWLSEQAQHADNPS